MEPALRRLGRRTSFLSDDNPPAPPPAPPPAVVAAIGIRMSLSLPSPCPRGFSSVSTNTGGGLWSVTRGVGWGGMIRDRGVTIRDRGYVKMIS